MSLFSIERRDTPSLCRGDSVSLLYGEEADSFSLQERESLFYRRESARLLYSEERDFFALQRRESVSPFFIERTSEDERVSLFSIKRRQTPFSLQKRECLSSTEKRERLSSR